jgi:hypothetical protein
VHTPELPPLGRSLKTKGIGEGLGAFDAVGEVRLAGPLAEDHEARFGAEKGGDGDAAIVPDSDGEMIQAVANNAARSTCRGSAQGKLALINSIE